MEENTNDSVKQEEKSQLLGNPLLNQQNVTIKDLVKDLFNAISDIEGRMTLTLKLLFTKPEVIIFEYISGKKSKYVRPFRFLIITLFFNYLFFNLFLQDNMESYFLDEFKDTFMNAAKEMRDKGVDAKFDSDAYFSTYREFTKLFVRFYKGLLCVQIPACMIANWIFFRRLKLNLASNVIMATFLLTSCSLIGTLFTPIVGLFVDFMTSSYFSLLPNGIYLAYAYTRMAKGYYWHPIRRGILMAFTLLFINVSLNAAFGLGIMFKVKSENNPIIHIKNVLEDK